MAKRRKSGLGAVHNEHWLQWHAAKKNADDFLLETRIALQDGNCNKAIRFLTNAAVQVGHAMAHYASDKEMQTTAVNKIREDLLAQLRFFESQVIACDHQHRS